MPTKTRALALAVATTLALPAQAFAYGGGGPGCTNLPEYDRAIGTLQGLSSCDMSVEEARRIIAAQGGQVYQQAAPDQPVRHRRHRVQELDQ